MREKEELNTHFYLSSTRVGERVGESALADSISVLPVEESALCRFYPILLMGESARIGANARSPIPADSIRFSGWENRQISSRIGRNR